MKRENGITLISLVITAMVMAILAGITISATIGDDGLLTTAQNQKEKIKKQQCSSTSTNSIDETK